jgi:hypothetical protein
MLQLVTTQKSHKNNNKASLTPKKEQHVFSKVKIYFNIQYHAVKYESLISNNTSRVIVLPHEGTWSPNKRENQESIKYLSGSKYNK